MEIEQQTYKGHKISIQTNDNPESPREWDNICELHYISTRYILGDIQHSSEELDKVIKQAKCQKDLVLPYYAYIHGGIALSVESFYNAGLPQGHAYFDSGQCGVIIIRKEKMLANFGGKIFSKKLKDKAKKIAKDEIEIYNQYFRGDVYGFIIDDGEDSCFGYYGNDTKDVIAEAKSIVDNMVKSDIKDHCS